MSQPDRELDKVIRRALAHEAERVRPDPAGLDRIRARIDAQGTAVRFRRPWLFTVAGAGVAAAAAVGLFAMFDNDTVTQTGNGDVVGIPSSPTPAPATSAPTSPQPSGTPSRPQPQSTQSPQRSVPADTPRRPPSISVSKPTVSPPTTPAPRVPDKPVAVPVYWMGEVVGRSDLGPRLYRTFTRVDGEPALGAVRAMVAGQSGDPDYTTAWAGAEVLSVTRDKGVITVDFARLPRPNLGAEASETAVQQLVYTAQGALQTREPVRITLNGGSAGDLFGHVDTSEPINAAARIDVQAFIWITAPVEGATVTSPITVTGVSSTFEATVNYRVRNLDSKQVVAESFTTATAGNGEFGDFRFALKLPKGRYVLECMELSAEDGRETHTDSKTFTVR